eukprot:14198875-Alexandrium_andersonii.AAC.1
MSASLVGSEMCIRDRTGTQLEHAGASGRMPLAGRTRNDRCVAIANPAPVSYTHLTLPTICSV